MIGYNVRLSTELSWEEQFFKTAHHTERDNNWTNENCRKANKWSSPWIQVMSSCALVCMYSTHLLNTCMMISTLAHLPPCLSCCWLITNDCILQRENLVVQNYLSLLNERAGEWIWMDGIWRREHLAECNNGCLSHTHKLRPQTGYLRLKSLRFVCVCERARQQGKEVR